MKLRKKMQSLKIRNLNGNTRGNGPCRPNIVPPHQPSTRNRRGNEGKKPFNCAEAIESSLNSSKILAQACKPSNVVLLTEKYNLLTAKSKSLAFNERKNVKGSACAKLGPFMSWNAEQFKLNDKCQSHLEPG